VGQRGGTSISVSKGAFEKKRMLEGNANIQGASKEVKKEPSWGGERRGGQGEKEISRRTLKTKKEKASGRSGVWKEGRQGVQRGRDKGIQRARPLWERWGP